MISYKKKCGPKNVQLKDDEVKQINNEYTF